MRIRMAQSKQTGVHLTTKAHILLDAADERVTSALGVTLGLRASTQTRNYKDNPTAASRCNIDTCTYPAGLPHGITKHPLHYQCTPTQTFQALAPQHTWHSIQSVAAAHLRRVVLRVAGRALCSALALHPMRMDQLSALIFQSCNLLFSFINH